MKRVVKENPPVEVMVLLKNVTESKLYVTTFGQRVYVATSESPVQWIFRPVDCGPGRGLSGYCRSLFLLIESNLHRQVWEFDNLLELSNFIIQNHVPNYVDKLPS